VSSLVISNNVGVTNLSYIAQNILQGQYQINTNTAGTSILGNIATNATPRIGINYTNATPVVWFGQTYLGTKVIVTNNTVAATASTNDYQYVTATTNNAINFFQDVTLPQDFFPAAAEYGIGVASITNSIAYLQVVSQQYTEYGYGTGAGSNIVNLVFSPIHCVNAPNPNNPIAGYTPDLEPTDGAYASAGDVWTVTYTNQISTLGAPTVYVTPVPRWMFPGAQGMRLRMAYTGTSTNAINLNSIVLGYWRP
jgi:hypothetical protein